MRHSQSSGRFHSLPPLDSSVFCLDFYLRISSSQVGDKITLADITVASALVYPMKLVMSPEYRKAFPCVTRWFTTCVNQPQFKAVIGTVELAKQEMTAEGAPAAPKKEKVSLHLGRQAKLWRLARGDAFPVSVHR